MENLMAELSRKELIDAIGKMSVMELAGLVKDMEAAFGVSAAAMPAAAAAPAAAGGEAAKKEEEKSQYDVTLESAGAEKIKVIKALRTVVPNLGLTEAKQMVEEAPTVVGKAVSKDDAQKMKKALEEAGAKVKLA
jgi:large subunit ribosomal protein L7/L12